MQYATYNKRENQSWFDIALQTQGTVEDVFDLMLLNNATDFDSEIPSVLTHQVQANYINKFLRDVITTDTNNLLSFTTSPAYINTGNGDSETTGIRVELKKTFRALEGQNIFDVAVQLHGNLDTVFDLMLENNLNINSSLLAGTELKHTQEAFMKQYVVTGEDHKTTIHKAFSIAFNEGFE